jgi:hypothetical protein
LTQKTTLKKKCKLCPPPLQIATDEINRGEDNVDKMIRSCGVPAAIGRRTFEADEMEGNTSSEEEPEKQDKVKHAKPRYLEIFEKKEAAIKGSLKQQQ